MRRYTLPHAGEHVNRLEIFRNGQKRHRIVAEHLQHLVEHAVGGIHEDGQHAADNDGRDEVRRVGDHLNRLFQLVQRQIVHQQREDDGRRKADDQRIHADAQRVLNQDPEIVAGKEAIEILEADPGAAPDAAANLVVLERHQNAVHRCIAEDRVIDDDRQEHDPQPPVMTKVVRPSVAQALFRIGRYFFVLHCHCLRCILLSGMATPLAERCLAFHGVIGWFNQSAL